MEWITIDNGIITGHFVGDELPANKNVVKVKNFNGRTGLPVNYYDDNWNQKKDSQLIQEGIICEQTNTPIMSDLERNKKEKLAQLSSIDMRSIRPLRAILSRLNSDVHIDGDEDLQVLINLENEAAKVREQLKKLM